MQKNPNTIENISSPFLTGDRIYLRTLEESDATDDYVAWLNDREVTRYMGSGKFPATHESIRQFIANFQDNTAAVGFAIIDRKSSQFIGTVTLHTIDWINRTAETGLMIGRKDFWGNGYAFEAWKLVLGYAFNRLGLRKITAGAATENKASIGSLKKLGFQVEGKLRAQYYIDGEYCDVVRFGLFQDEFLGEVIS